MMTLEQCRFRLQQLLLLPRETGWVEFKVNDYEPQEIGEYLSALSNSAVLDQKDAAYIVWGVENGTHRVVGTTFKPRMEKVKGQELENWLTTQLEPPLSFHMHEFDVDGLPVVLFEVQPAAHQPTRFRGVEYIRIGSYKKHLADHAPKERELWQLFARQTFENRIAMANMDLDGVFRLIDFGRYFEMIGLPFPEDRAAIRDRLIQERIIVSSPGNTYDITNLGAILFAKDLRSFESLGRKALRTIIYKGKDRTETLKEHKGGQGYALAFQPAIAYINDQLPQNEQIGQALRKEVKMYPQIAIRELAANALIHQDFGVTGTGPIIEVFADRIEVTNPGTPLIDTLRFIDEPPRSRNEQLAAFLRRLSICEERGSGIDKVVFNVELFQLPAPQFSVTSNHTKAVLFAYKKLSDMDKDDRVRACYQHACLRYVSNERMTNESLRRRFAISDKNYPLASKIIREALHDGLVKPFDPKNRSKKHAKYVPFWA